MAKPQKERAAARPLLTSAQLREAERGLRLVLARTYPPAWIARHVRDVLAEAIRDYVVWVDQHGPARNPVAWLVERGRLRASNLNGREIRRAGPTLDLIVGTLADDEDLSPEATALEVDRRRRIKAALSEIPEEERRLIELVYYERLSITAAGRQIGWGKSSAAERHARALAKLRTLIGPRDAITPGVLGLLAHESLGPDRRRLAGRIADRLVAFVRDLADLVGRALGSTARGAGDLARRAAPLTDNGSAAVAGGGIGRVIAQCGALAAICGVALVAGPPVAHLIGPPHLPRAGAPPIRPRQGRAAEPGGESGTASTEEAPHSTATARSEEGRRIERHRRHRLRHRHRVKARRARRKARRARERKKAKAARVRQERKLEEEAAAEEARRQEEESVVESEVVEPETVEPEAESAAPPPATGGQTREEFGL